MVGTAGSNWSKLTDAAISCEKNTGEEIIHSFLVHFVDLAGH